MKGTFAEPQPPPSGIRLVVVNGRVTYENGKYTGAKAGKVERRQ